MTPLQVTATVPGQISLPNGPIALDGLLAWAVAARDGLPPASSAEECVPIDIPVEREPKGRFHLASVGFTAFEAHDVRWTNRRFPLAEAQGMGDAKLKRIQIQAGPCKSYRLPLEVGHLVDDTITWWCLGDAEQIKALLSLVHYLGKRRGVGLGKVQRWTVEPCEPWPGFPVVRDGKPLRTLPPDWPGLDEPGMAYTTLSYPYWDRRKEVLCAVPG